MAARAWEEGAGCEAELSQGEEEEEEEEESLSPRETFIYHDQSHSHNLAD